MIVCPLVSSSESETETDHNPVEYMSIISSFVIKVVMTKK